MLSLKRGLDFRGFGARFSEVKSLVFRRLLRGGSARRPKTSTRRHKTLPRRPKTPPRRPKTAPRRAQDAPKTPQDAPGAPQDGPRCLPDEVQGAPGAEKIGPNSGSKSDLQRNPLPNSILERFGVDFGGLGKVLGRVLGRFWEGFGDYFEIDFSWILRVVRHVRKPRLLTYLLTYSHTHTRTTKMVGRFAIQSRSTRLLEE